MTQQKTKEPASEQKKTKKKQRENKQQKEQNSGVKELTGTAQASVP